jgi:hypothetical protein
MQAGIEGLDPREIARSDRSASDTAKLSCRRIGSTQSGAKKRRCETVAAIGVSGALGD